MCLVHSHVITACLATDLLLVVFLKLNACPKTRLKILPDGVSTGSRKIFADGTKDSPLPISRLLCIVTTMAPSRSVFAQLIHPTNGQRTGGVQIDRQIYCRTHLSLCCCLIGRLKRSLHHHSGRAVVSDADVNGWRSSRSLAPFARRRLMRNHF